MRRLRRLLPTYLLASVYAFLLVLPLLTLLSASLRSEADLYAPGLLPPRVSLEAYAEALTEFPLGRFLLNSLLVSTAVTLGVLLTSLLAAYALTRLRFRGREVLFGLAVALLLVPGEVTFLPLYLLVDRLGWLDSYLALAVPFLASPLGVFLLRQYLKTLPEDYFDAARIDGANHAQILRHVALPLSAPALGALAALTFIGTWNMYLWPLVVTKSREMQTAQMVVSRVMCKSLCTGGIPLLKHLLQHLLHLREPL
ncbi:carbohydrate ABC transporter permease [Thermus sp. CCB_US3_UF1]|uniref:carbohydrate ABC transporter permease n=1 Tax=Thermus sp. CCB_US3_UF1 TaxID=1111069 RepID=UPI0009DAFAE0|nr:carbohydrate ABC transporter permease [Thermus sp. CCB_US3_UF1]